MRLGVNVLYTSGDPSEITLNNLALISRGQARLGESRVLELYELADMALARARELCDAGLYGYELLSMLASESVAPDYPTLSGTPEAIRGVTERYLSRASALDRAVFSSLFSAGAHRLGLPVTVAELLPSGAGDESFIYSRNPLADEAFDVFSQEFSDPRVKYGRSLSDCVRAVTSGECRFCLLPLEEKGGSRLPTVAELIFRGDLKISGVTPVFGFDGTADLKYALLSRDFLIPTVNPGDDLYLEIRVSSELTDSASLFAVIDLFSLSIYRVNTVSFVTEGETESYYSLVLRDGGSGFDGLLIYLSLFCEDFTPVGIYKNLE